MPEAPAFASVVVASASPPTMAPAAPSNATITTSAASVPPSSVVASPSAVIEVAIGDVVVRVVGEVESARLVAVLRAVRRAS